MWKLSRNNFVLSLALIVGLNFFSTTKILAQPSPKSGVLVTWYSDETFSNVYSVQTNKAVDIVLGVFGGGSFSGVFQGYVSVTNTATYDFQMEAAAHGEFQFDNSLVGSVLGATGTCSPNLNEIRTTYSRTLIAGQYYPFRIRLLTGCNSYNYHVTLKWRKSTDIAFAYVPTNVFFLNNPTAISNVVANIQTAVEIYWPTETNKQYVVQWKSDLNGTNWQTISPVFFGDGRTNSAFDSTRFSEKRFYRVISW